MDGRLIAGPGSRKRRQQLAAIEVPLVGAQRRAYRTWRQCAERAGGPLSRYLKFADGWFPEARDAWLRRAADAGLWQPSTRDPYPQRRCDEADPGDVLVHVGDVDGSVVHLAVTDSSAVTVLSGGWCHAGQSDAALERTWTDEQRLSYDELIAGESCRGCGRPFYGGPPDVPVYERTAKQQVAIQAERDAFNALHSDCAPAAPRGVRVVSWTISGGNVTHCARCCPPPPLAPETEERVVAILAQLFAQHREDSATTARRWSAAASNVPRG